MHKFKFNQFEVEFFVSPKSPLLIKSGGISANPSLPDMQFVRTFIAGKGESIYIPGSSLKGTLRSYAESILKTMLGERMEGACNPFGENSCGKNLKEEENSQKIYKDSCRACKIFGNTKLKARISVMDAHPDGDLKTEIRHGVAISRLTHAVAQGPFDMEVVVNGKFKTSLIIENFECWQIGLVAHSLNALRNGWLKVGFGKNRGLGEVNVDIEKTEFKFVKKPDQLENEIWGTGKFLKHQERENYGIRKNDFCKLIKPKALKDDGIFITMSYSGEQWDEISDKFIVKVMEALKG